MFPLQLLHGGEGVVGHALLVADEEAGFDSPVGNGLGLDAVHRFGGLVGLCAQLQQAVAQVVDVRVGKVTDLATFGVLGQGPQPKLYKGQTRYGDGPGGVGDEACELQGGVGAGDERVNGADLLVEVQSWGRVRGFRCGSQFQGAAVGVTR